MVQVQPQYDCTQVSVMSLGGSKGFSSSSWSSSSMSSRRFAADDAPHDAIGPKENLESGEVGAPSARMSGYSMFLLQKGGILGEGCATGVLWSGGGEAGSRGWEAGGKA